MSPMSWMLPARRLSVAAVVMAIGLAFVAGAALAGEGGAARDGEQPPYDAAEWRGSSTGFGLVVRADDTYYQTSSQQWENVPGMTIRYNVNPNAPKAQSLLISYTEEHYCTQSPAATAWCNVRVLVDGVPATPSYLVYDSVQHASPGGAPQPFATHTGQFVAGPLEPGPHFVVVQWQVDEANATFASSSRTLSVMGFYHNQLNVIDP